MTTKVQALVSDDVQSILDSLQRKADKSKFIEMSIRKGFEDPEIKKFFAWKNHQNTKIN